MSRKRLLPQGFYLVTEGYIGLREGVGSSCWTALSAGDLAGPDRRRRLMRKAEECVTLHRKLRRETLPLHLDNAWRATESLAEMTARHTTGKPGVNYRRRRNLAEAPPRQEPSVRTCRGSLETPRSRFPAVSRATLDNCRGREVLARWHNPWRRPPGRGAGAKSVQVGTRNLKSDNCLG